MILVIARNLIASLAQRLRGSPAGSAKVPFLEGRASVAMIATSLIVAMVGIALPFSRLGSSMGFVPLPWAYWLPLTIILLGYAILTHLMKAWFSRRFGLD
jgi:P-type Mg2+ transporter